MSGSDTVSPPDSAADDPGHDASPPRVSALHTSPDRLILTEDGNADGWLVSDAAVDLAERT